MLRALTELAVTAMAANIDERKERLRALTDSRSRGQRDSSVLTAVWHLNSAACRNGLARAGGAAKVLAAEWLMRRTATRAFKQFTGKEPMLAHLSS